MNERHNPSGYQKDESSDEGFPKHAPQQDPATALSQVGVALLEGDHEEALRLFQDEIIPNAGISNGTYGRLLLKIRGAFDAGELDLIQRHDL